MVVGSYFLGAPASLPALNNMITNLKCRFYLNACFVLSMIAIQPVSASHEYNFPMVGSQANWVEANELFHRAISLKHAGSPERPDECIDVIKKAIAIYPYDPAFYCELAEECLRRQRLSEAEQAINNAVKLEPTYGRAYFEKAQILMQQGAISKGIQTMEISARLSPEDPDIWISLSAYRSLAGSGLTAEEDLTKCLKLVDSGVLLNPFNDSADFYRWNCLQNLGGMRLRQGRYVDAKKFFEQAQIADKNHTFANTLQGQIDKCNDMILDSLPKI